MDEEQWRQIAPGLCTVAAYMPRCRTLCPPRSLDTYGAGFTRLEQAYGHLALEQVRLTDLQVLRDRIRLVVGQDIVRVATSRGRRLRSYNAEAHGHGAAENFVRSVRHFFRCAVTDGVLDRSPAIDLQAPRRPAAPERPLTPVELRELFTVGTTTGNDPVLDGLLLSFVRHTACRRGGALTLRVGALDADRGSVVVSEKFGQTRELPLRPALVDRLLQFANDRGGNHPHDQVFRYSNGQPITSRRFDYIFNRLDRASTWSEALDVGAHWLRHTTLTDIAAVAGLPVTQAYAGHSKTGGDLTLRYIAVDFRDLQAAYVAVFGAS